MVRGVMAAGYFSLFLFAGAVYLGREENGRKYGGMKNTP